MRLIHLGGEATWLGEADESFAPGLLVRGREQDTIDVEDAGVQWTVPVGPEFGRYLRGHQSAPLPVVIPNRARWNESVRLVPIAPTAPGDRFGKYSDAPQAV